MTLHHQGKYFMMTALVVTIGIVGYYILNAPDRRGPQERIGDAMNELADGNEKAVRQLKNRTTGERLRDAARDTGEDIQEYGNP